MAESVIKKGLHPLKTGGVSPSACSTSAGTIDSGEIRYAYNDEYVAMFARLNLSNIPVNVRPAVTIPLPADIPTFTGYGSATTRGSGTNIVITDNAYLNHTKGNAFATGGFNWFIGPAPAGYATFVVPAVVPK